MTSASFESRRVPNPGTFAQLPETPPPHACQARRMKGYAGQRRFQAPVPDDFAKGMLAPEHAPGEDDSFKPFQRALASVLNRLGALWRGHRPG